MKERFVLGPFVSSSLRSCFARLVARFNQIDGYAFTGTGALVTADDLGRLLDLTGAKFLVSTMPLLATAREAASRADAPQLIVVGEGAVGAIAFSELLGRAPPMDDISIALDSVATVPCSTRVTAYKKIRAVEFIEQIPRSPTGKILRRMLPV
jgi:acyl-CoA synthetase (AMP-forming)/AMP-acid ligase II